MNTTQELFQKLIRTTISEALLADAIDLYATQEVAAADREEFIEKYSDERYQPIIRKAVLDVVVAVVAALRAESDEDFNTIINMLDVEERDDVILQMKRCMLMKMLDDAVSDMSSSEEEVQFRERMSYFDSNIG